MALSVQEIEAQIERKLTYTEIQQLHREVGVLEDSGYHEIVDQGVGMFKKGDK